MSTDNQIDEAESRILSSADLATLLWNYGESVQWGNGGAMMSRMDIQAIIDEWLLSANPADAHIRRIFTMIDKVKDDSRPSDFDYESSPSSGFEWACEQIAEELGEMYPHVVDEMNAEYKAACQAVAERYNQLNPPEPVVFVEANTTFWIGRRVYFKSDIEKMIAEASRQR